jgi:hypothetical protein
MTLAWIMETGNMIMARLLGNKITMEDAELAFVELYALDDERAW